MPNWSVSLSRPRMPDEGPLDRRRLVECVVDVAVADRAHGNLRAGGQVGRPGMHRDLPPGRSRMLCALPQRRPVRLRLLRRCLQRPRRLQRSRLHRPLLQRPVWASAAGGAARPAASAAAARSRTKRTIITSFRPTQSAGYRTARRKQKSEVSSMVRGRLERSPPSLPCLDRKINAGRGGGAAAKRELVRGQSSDLRNLRTLIIKSVTPSPASASICGQSTFKPTPLRNVPRMTTR